MKLNVTVYFKKKIDSTYFRAAPTGFAAYLPWEKIVPQERTPTISIFVFVSTDKLKKKNLIDVSHHIFTLTSVSKEQNTIKGWRKLCFMS